MRATALALLCLPLAAQVALSSRPAPNDLDIFLARLGPGHPVLILLDAKDGLWEKAIRALFRKDPLPEYFPQRGFKVLPVHEGVGAQLASREGWEAVPRWLLLDGSGRIHRESKERPTPESLASALRDAGWRPAVEMHDRVLATRPGLMEVQRFRLQLLLELAEVRTRALLDLAEPAEGRGATCTITDMEGYDFSDACAPEDPFQGRTVRDLPDADDEAIWGPFSRALAQHVAQDTWATNGPLRIITPYAKVSPRCREAYGKVLDAVEAALRRLPRSPSLWALWIPLADAVERPLEPLLASITPSPFPVAAWPPPALRLQAMREAMAAKHWDRAETLVKEHWARLLEVGVSEDDDQNLLTSAQWDRIGQPYVEILLRQERLSDAETLLDAWERRHGWDGARERAAGIAQTCGQTELAARWKRAGTP